MGELPSSSDGLKLQPDFAKVWFSPGVSGSLCNRTGHRASGQWLPSQNQNTLEKDRLDIHKKILLIGKSNERGWLGALHTLMKLLQVPGRASYLDPLDICFTGFLIYVYISM